MPTLLRNCIFCGAPGKTGEHIFAQWLKAHIPRIKREYRTRTVIIDGDHIEHSSETHRGDPHSRQLRVVCAQCNNGWMSQLHSRAIPHLTPLLRNERHTIEPYPARIIAGWMAVSMGVAQFTSQSFVSVTQRELDHIRLMLEPPPGWKVWIGSAQRSRFASFAYSPFSVAENIPQAINDGGFKKPNSHATFMCFGKHLFGHALASRGAPEVMLQWEYPPLFRGALRRVWPPVDEAIEWPPENALTDLGLITLYEYFTGRAHAAHKAIADD